MCMGVFEWLKNDAIQVIESLSEDKEFSHFNVRVELGASHSLRERLLEYAYGIERVAAAHQVCQELLEQAVSKARPQMKRTDAEGMCVSLQHTVFSPLDDSSVGSMLVAQGKSRKRKEEHGLSKTLLSRFLEKHSAAVLADNVLASDAPRPPFVVPKMSVTGAELWVGGRYKKYARNVPQTKWVNKGQRIGALSVEERVGDVVCPLTGGTYTLGAAGREDRDVRFGLFLFLFLFMRCCCLLLR